MPRKKILIVDDEAGFTRLLKMAMHKYDIHEENDSRRALETAHNFKPDLILLDVIMPGLDGSQLAEQLEADAELKRVPIVFVTAIVSQREAGDRPKTIGNRHFLAKPVSPEVLEKCIEEHLAA